MCDIADAQGFVAAVVIRSRLSLTHHDREDLHQYLLVECWRLSLDYDSAGRRPCFSNYAATILRRRVVDWQRKRFGRTTWKAKHKTYTRPRINIESLDNPGRLERDLGARAVDPQVDRDPDLAGLHGAGGRPRAGDHAELGLEPPPRAR